MGCGFGTPENLINAIRIINDESEIKITCQRQHVTAIKRQCATPGNWAVSALAAAQCQKRFGPCRLKGSALEKRRDDIVRFG
jgi:hypothetical protein